MTTMRKIFLCFSFFCVAAVSGGLELKWFYPLATLPSGDTVFAAYDRMVYGSTAAIANLPGVDFVGTDPDSFLEIVIGSDEFVNPEDPTDTLSLGLWRCLDAHGNLEWYRGTFTDESRSSVAILDFYGADGMQDIIGGTTSGWNIEAMDRFGNFLWTFPTPPITGGPFAWHSSPAVADVVPDVPGLEVVIGSNADIPWEYSYWGVWCLQADPSDLIDHGLSYVGWLGYPEPPGGTDGIDWDVIWYQQTACPVISTPCLVDMNGDGVLDVVIGVGWRSWDICSEDLGKILCLDGRNGYRLWEINTGSDGVSGSAAAADFDHDGDFEVVIGSYNGSLYFIDGDEDGSHSISSSEMHIYSHSGSIYGSPAIGDVDGDYQYEVVAPIGNGILKVFQYTPASGATLEWSRDLGDSILSSPALAGNPDDPMPWPMFRQNSLRNGFYAPLGETLHIFIAADRGRNGFVYHLDGFGRVVDSARICDKVYASPVVADIDMDCELDLVITGASQNDSLGWMSEGPDTIFCFSTGLEIHGCAEPELHPHIADVFTEGCTLVRAVVCVYDEDSDFVRGLEITNFAFTENGTPITPPNLRMINECPPESAKVDVVLLLDFSTSMDDEVTLLYTHIPEFVTALSETDYRIAILVFNGCPTELDGVCKYVRTYFTGPSACDLDLSAGPNWWANDFTEFSCLFTAGMEMYTWAPAYRGSGYEDQYGAILRANGWLDFRPDAQKVFVLFTDERPIVNYSFCDPDFDETPAGLDSIISYCLRENIIVIPVTPHNGEFYYSSGESPERAYYTGYYTLGPATGGAWFYLYSGDFGELVTAIGEEIATDSCCYEFIWRETIFCTDMVNLEVSVFRPGTAIFGVDDTSYDALCNPQFRITLPEPCRGITSCSGLGFFYAHLNPADGALVPGTLRLVVNHDTLTISDPGVSVMSSGIYYTPPDDWQHGDTVVFWLEYVENIDGCPGSAPPCSFVVDIVPPVVLSPFPAQGETLTTIGLVPVSATLFDDFSGVDTSVFSARNVTVTLGPDTIPFTSLRFEPGLRFVLDGLNIMRDGHYYVCVNDLDDSPDYEYCPPNHLDRWCWDFFVITIENHIWFGDTTEYPCLTARIPLSIDNLSGAEYTSLDVWFHTDFSLLTPIDLDTTNVIAPIRRYVLEEVFDDSLWHLRIEWAGPVSGLDGGVIVWLLANVSCAARGGDFAPIIIDNARINAGYPRVTWSPGFFYAQWRIWAWVHDIVVERYGDTLKRTLNIGANTYATKGYDPTIDLLYLEPPPGEVDAFITIYDPAYPAVEKLKRSIQNFDLPDRWIIRTDSETLAYVRWDPNYFPDGRFSLNGVINMKIDSVYLWRVSEIDSVVIEWSLPELAQYEMSLVSGWNLISLPFVPTHHSPAEVFPGTVGAFAFDAEHRIYVYAPQFDQGVGYWIYAFSETTFEIAGTAVDRYERQIFGGWNLIGSTSEPVPVSEICTSPSGGLLLPLYKYEGGSYMMVYDTIYPGRGYWALSLENGTITVPSGGIYCRSAVGSPVEWTSVISCEFENRTESLIFGKSKSARDGIDACDVVFPPSPPDGKKDRLSCFRRDIFELSKDISAEMEWWLVIDSAAIIRVSLPDEIHLVLVSERDIYELFDGRQLSLNPGVYRICSHEKAQVPELLLMPNYPNPFNATTLIPFALPKMEKISLSVHDLSGRCVATILNDILEPGYHSVRFDADNLPSGIYFVVLSAFSDKRTNRIVIIK